MCRVVWEECQELGNVWRYAEDCIKALAVDPKRCLVYWAEGAAIRHIAERRWPGRFAEQPRLLRWSSEEGDMRFVPCKATRGAQYVGQLTAGRRYLVEYGVRLGERFLPLLAAQVQMPGAVRSSQQEAMQMPMQHEAISSYSIYNER